MKNYDLARDNARQALQLTPEDGDPTMPALAWHALGFVQVKSRDVVFRG